MEEIFENGWIKLLVWPVAFFLIIMGIPLLIALVNIEYEKGKKRIKQLDRTDFEKNKEYYREILKLNSPLIIGYLDNLELNKNIIIAEMLILKEKKIPDLKNGIENTNLQLCEEKFLKYFLSRLLS